MSYYNNKNHTKSNANVF